MRKPGWKPSRVATVVLSGILLAGTLSTTGCETLIDMALDSGRSKHHDDDDGATCACATGTTTRVVYVTPPCYRPNPNPTVIVTQNGCRNR
ncbi:hypothetical protein HY251_12160 [bacterium]|nr:hypothetical protein [bacterium]